MDRVVEAREAIARDGAIISGHMGPRQHPAVSIENASALHMARLLRQLGLSEADLDAAEKEPRRHGSRGALKVV